MSLRPLLLLGLVSAFGACGARTLTPDGGGAAGAGTAGTASAAGSAGTVGTPEYPPLRISGAEAVQRIAAVLWQQPPDDALVQSASGYQLEAELRGVTGQMLLDPRAKVGLGALFRGWLGLDGIGTLTKDPGLFPEFTPALQADMESEIVDFGIDVTLADGDLRRLLTDGEGFVNARLAAIYGIPGVTGDALQRVGRPQGYAGLLTEAGIQALGSLATRNSPSHRGKYILEKLLCEQVPAAPPNVPPLMPMPGQTLRAALQAEVASADCQACHSTFDPLGLVFEGFDAIGRARATDNGAPVDTSNLTVMVGSSSSTPSTVNSPYDLGLLLASSPDVQSCVAQQWLSFALGRPLTAADQASLSLVNADFATSDNQLQELIAAVLTSDAFLAPKP